MGVTYNKLSFIEKKIQKEKQELGLCLVIHTYAISHKLKRVKKDSKPTAGTCINVIILLYINRSISHAHFKGVKCAFIASLSGEKYLLLIKVALLLIFPLHYYY